MSPDEERLRRFEETVLPHLDSAHNIARWLVGDEQEARDVVQDACVRALRHFDGFRGGDARPWLLAIVRNCAYDALRRRAGARLSADADVYEEEARPTAAPDAPVEAELARAADKAALERAMAGLPPEFCEALVLRELEGLSYKDIAAATEVPIGTVMSRLSRGRKLLLKNLRGAEGKLS